MLNKIKKIFLLLILAVAFIWMVLSFIVLYEASWQWYYHQMTNMQYVSQIFYMLLKNVLTLIAVLIANKNWY